MIFVGTGPGYAGAFSLTDNDGEFGFIRKSKKTTKWEFKLTEEKYLTVDDMETIASYMRTIMKYEHAS